jgi:hypothetical protein
VSLVTPPEATVSNPPKLIVVAIESAPPAIVSVPLL